jgi:putative solute:sodium symporter small subunit
MAIVIPAATPASSEESASASDVARRRHWQRTLRLTVALLIAWFIVGFVVTCFARDVDFDFFGWPFSFWVAAQGGVIVFVALLAIYARRMDAIDRELAERGPPPADADADAIEPNPAPKRAR